MKKGFGWFFIVCGVLSIVRGFAMMSFDTAYGGRLIICSVGFIILGIWMVSSSKPKKQLIN